MKINKHNFKEYGARVLEWTYQPFLVSRSVFQPEDSIHPSVGLAKPEPKTMSLVLEFTDKLMISNFLSELLSHDENVLDLNDGYIYRCWCPSLSAPVEEVYHGWYKVNIPLLVLQTTAERAIHITSANTSIDVQGNWESECRFEITPLENISSITINDYTIKNLTKDVKVILDGVTKKIYTNKESNKYGDITLKNHKFPTLLPGTQVIKVNTMKADIWLYYQPIFV